MSYEDFATQYNKICIRLKDNVLDKMYGQSWDLVPARSIEADLVNHEHRGYIDELVDIIDYYIRHKDANKDADFEYNIKELKSLLNYLENLD